MSSPQQITPLVASRLIALTSLFFGWVEYGHAAPSDSIVVFNEVMYHPADPVDSEWIELYNQMAVDVDMSGWQLSGGIDFSFPEGTILPGGSFLVVAANPATIAGSIGPFTGSLSNGGEKIELLNNSDRLMDSLRYDDESPWPPAADGSGASLVKTSRLLATGDDSSWRASLVVGGTPGSSEDFSLGDDLRFSEIEAWGDASFFVELHNADDQAIELGGVRIVSSNGTDLYTLPAQLLPAGDYLSIDATTLGYIPQLGERLYLFAAGTPRVLDGVLVGDSLQARRPEDPAHSRFFVPNGPTPGLPNTFSFRDEIVINEIMYHARPSHPSGGTPPTYLDEVVVPSDAVWKYDQTGVFPGPNWMESAFDDSAWPSGPAALGVESAILSEPIRTPLTLGPTTYYFRNTFNYTGDPSTDLLRLRLLIDDGAVVFINGVEAVQRGFQGGNITNETFASFGVLDAEYITLDLPTNLLVSGSNLIAVEVHQASATSSDIVFGMEVISRTETDPGVPASLFTESKEEWIELYNRSGVTMDLSGWRLTEGIEFTFPGGTLLAEDEYLVIADDLAAFNAAHPGVPAIGEYSGGLGNGSDRIVLLDELDNPADEVSYFDGGRWDGDADGYGPSLELINPDADNAQGEAWQASDEGARSDWHTYTYRGIADTPIPGAPTIWQEFALGMLHGRGEVLVDDLSVIEDPDGSAIERLQNGTFDGGSNAAWRFRGNHQRSFVEDDGTGNDVLHIIASGATEYQSNQLETTFANGASIANGQEYEISFRARWLSGSSHLNTRLYFNRAPASISLEVPGSNGTPGAPNSRLVTNSAPTFNGLRHSPLLPNIGQAVTVSTTAVDSDGIANATLNYRPNGGTWSTVEMTVDSAGTYSGSIPGQPQGTIMQFYVEATDSLGAISTIPREGPASRALYEVNDGVTGGSEVHDLRAIMLTADSDFLHNSSNSLSNELLGATVLYQGQAYYDVGIRLKGSFVGRDAIRVGFNLKFNPDQLFRGIHDKVAVDRSTHGDIGVDEIILKHVAARAGGIPAMYDDLVQFIAPRSQDNLRAAIRMAGFDDIYLDSQFDEGSEGTMFEFEVYRWATTTVDGNPESIKRAGGLDSPNGFANIPIQGFGDEKEDYRWHCLITSNRRKDDYTAIIPFLQTMGLEASELAAEAPKVMDVDAVLRTLAYQSLFGPGDSTFTGFVDHNFRLYAQPNGKILYMPWDWDSAFQRATNAPLVGVGNFAKLVNIPANLRVFHGHVKDIIDQAYNANYMANWTSHYGNLGGQNFSGRLNYIANRSNFALSQLPAQIPFVITTNGGNDFTEQSSTATLAGDGWIDITEIRASTNGAPLEVTWTDSDSWTVSLPLGGGANLITLLAYDRNGNQVGSDSITVTSSSNTELASASNLVVAEILYNPYEGGSEFIELLNISPVNIDLTGVRFVDGIEFEFAPNTILASGALFTIDASDFLNDTKLSNGGEQLHLTAADGSTIFDFTYDDADPWPEFADGNGCSLVLIQPLQNPDPSDPLNWRCSSTPNGSPGTSDSIPYSGGDIFEYVLGNTQPTLIFTPEGNIWTYQLKLSSDDYIVTTETSPDLDSWTTQATPTQPIQINPDGTATYELIFPPVGAHPKSFTRLKVIPR